MSFRTAGIHHVTGIASDPQRNLDFYAGILGLRLVKRTVNFDDPTTYHFYFGDEQGHPGSILTFFPWPDARRGRQGGGQVAVTSFAILPSSVGFWIERLIKKQVEFDQPAARYEDERVIAFKDHDGFMGELVAHPSAESHTGWAGAGVPAEHAIRGIYSITLWLDANELTGQLLPLDAHAGTTLREAPLEAPVVLCLGAERAGLPGGLSAQAVRIPVATDSLNVAMAATVALYEVANRMAGHA